jgi:acyl-CoA reductase-like NAD-dependent aldehyde dehydrogenase
LLEQRAPELAKTMTMEMGKPFGQSMAEVQKCAGHIEYAVKHSLELMADEQLSTRQHKAFVTH